MYYRYEVWLRGCEEEGDQLLDRCPTIEGAAISQAMMMSTLDVECKGRIVVEDKGEKK